MITITPLTSALLGIVVTFTTLSIVALGLRVWSRLVTIPAGDVNTKRLWWDDYLAMASLVGI